MVKVECSSILGHRLGQHACVGDTEASVATPSITSLCSAPSTGTEVPNMARTRSLAAQKAATPAEPHHTLQRC